MTTIAKSARTGLRAELAKPRKQRMARLLKNVYFGVSFIVLEVGFLVGVFAISVKYGLAEPVAAVMSILLTTSVSYVLLTNK